MSDNMPNAWRDVTVRDLAHVIEDLRVSTTSDLAAAEALAPLWPSMIGIIEVNCLPGNELHPVVRPIYARFAALAADRTSPEEVEYAAWLAGDIAVSEPAHQRYMSRWRNRQSQAI